MNSTRSQTTCAIFGNPSTLKDTVLPTYADVMRYCQKSIQTCDKLPIVEFQKIETTLPLIDKEDLSSDQKYLLDMVIAITTGDCPTTLANRNPGILCHSRWLTTANRILRLYVSTEKPTKELELMVTYVLSLTQFKETVIMHIRKMFY
uniref:Uncharacterized protein n=1 Tax=Cacopsylla melanoneura TaxID=428564 RepID=A0A8D8R121_9HEMI